VEVGLVVQVVALVLLVVSVAVLPVEVGHPVVGNFLGDILSILKSKLHLL
jgi:hypothetical protein